MKTRTIHALCVLLFVAPLNAREIKVGMRWPQLVATSGRVFRNVKFTFVSPREVRFMHTDGIGSLPLSDVVLAEDVTVNSPSPELMLGPLGSMMTPEERRVSGIDKLSNDEQAELAKWVRYTVDDQVKVALENRGALPLQAPSSAEAALAGGSATMAAPPEGQAGHELDGPGAFLLASSAPANPYGPVSSTAADSPPLPGSSFAPALALLPPPRPSSSESDLPLTTSSFSAAPRSALLPPAAGRPHASVSGVVESTIAGEFRGFEAERTFRLVNGQVWRQRENHQHTHLAFDPQVIIYPKDGAWLMKVDGVDKPVRVVPLN